MVVFAFFSIFDRSWRTTALIVFISQIFNFALLAMLSDSQLVTGVGIILILFALDLTVTVILTQVHIITNSSIPLKMAGLYALAVIAHMIDSYSLIYRTPNFFYNNYENIIFVLNLFQIMIFWKTSIKGFTNVFERTLAMVNSGFNISTNNLHNNIKIDSHMENEKCT